MRRLADNLALVLALSKMTGFTQLYWLVVAFGHGLQWSNGVACRLRDAGGYVVSCVKKWLP